MAVNKVVYGTETLIDLTDDTATEVDVASGKKFHLANGVQATGTASVGGGDEDQYPVRNDGYSHIWVRVDDITRPEVEIAFTPGASSGGGTTILWGDGTSEVKAELHQTAYSHTYQAEGLYEIVLQNKNNSTKGISFNASATKSLMGDPANEYNARRLVAAELVGGNNTNTVGRGYNFTGCVNLEKVALGYRTWLTYNFGYLPSQYSFTSDSGTIKWALPNLKQFVMLGTGNLTLLQNADVFNNCPALKTLEGFDPSATQTRAAQRMFRNCMSLKTIPTFGAMTAVGESYCENCTSLEEVTIPSAVTSIGANAFKDCFALKEMHCQPETPPTLDATAFTGTPSDMVIYVPSASLEAYQTAENWSTYASRMVGE